MYRRLVFHLSQPCPLAGAGAGQRRRSPRPLFPVSPARTLPLTCSTAADVDARRLERAGRSSSEPHQQPRRVVVVVPPFIGASDARRPEFRVCLVPLAFASSSVRHRERAPTGPAPLPPTSTRGAKSKQFLARRRRRRRRRAAATPGRRSLPRQQARRVVALGSAFASCCRYNRDRWTAAESGDMAALRLNDARRTGGEDAAQVPGVDGISFTVHPLVTVSCRIRSLRPKF